MSKQTPNVDELLDNWEEIYKRGLLSFWLLLLLQECDSYPYEMNAKIFEITQGSIKASEQSIYRALKRFESLGVVRSFMQTSDSGPDRRYYTLTSSGNTLLKRFIQRNIFIFQHPAVQAIIQTLFDETQGVDDDE